MKIEVDQGSNSIRYCPDDGTQSGTVILMHGLGDSADGIFFPVTIICKYRLDF